MQPGAGTTRLAPSPTGSLHLGHACSFLATWALARRSGWRVLLRLDDLDAARVRSGGGDIVGTLLWLGLDWDGPPVRQSDRLDRYRAAMRRLAHDGRIYESPHSRQTVREAAAAVGAPHEGEGHVVFPPELRPPSGPAWSFRKLDVNHRFRTDAVEVHVEDELRGPCRFEPAARHGDFLVWTKAGVPSYQLACAVDDAELGVTDVVRGEDLLESAALQGLLLERLGHRPPRWWHLPLVRDEEGRRLAKRDGAAGLDTLRDLGVPPERVRGLVAWWLGLGALEPLSPEQLTSLTDPEALRAASIRVASGRGPFVSVATIAWLRGSSVTTDTLLRHARGDSIE